jgi:septal ring factor EnvC (AmiA/AmiB activator)
LITNVSIFQLAKSQHETAQQEVKYDRTVQCFMRRTKNVNLEVFSLKCEAQRRERYIRYLESKLRELIDDIDRADRELRQPAAGSGRN